MKQLFACILTLFILDAFGQGVTQSAEGKSAVIVEGSALGIDITEAELSFGYNTLNKLAIEKNKSWFGGADVRAKNAKGVGKLFSNSEVAPQGNLNAYIGHYYSNAKFITTNSVEYRALKIKQIREFSVAIRQVIEKNGILLQDATKRQLQINALLNDAAPYIKGTHPILNFPGQIVTANADAEIQAYREAVKNELTAVAASFDTDILTTARRRAVLESKFNGGLDYFRWSWFLFGGLNAISFKKFGGIDMATLANSFVETGDVGGQVGAGLNAEWGRVRLGVTYNFKRTNNFATLSPAEFIVKERVTSGNQELTSEEKVTAYKGLYGEVDVNELNADVIVNLSLNKANSHFVLINPYIRASLFSRDSLLLPNKTNIGTGFYFYKKEGNFLGGFYVEAPDVANNMEKRKPLEDQKIRPALRRLTFGVVAKISFNSVLSW